MFRGLTVIVLMLSLCTNLQAQTAHDAQEKIRKSLVYLEATAETENGVPLKSIATGFIVGAEGQVLTVYHLIGQLEQKASSINQTINKGSIKITAKLGAKHATEIPASFVKPDTIRDLLVLDLPSLSEEYIATCVRTDFDPRSQEDVYTAGFPKGDVPYITDSGKIASPDGLNQTWITPMVINPGQSGSPIFTSSGAVVGIAKGQMRDSNNKTVEGQYVVLPIDDARALLPNLRSCRVRLALFRDCDVCPEMVVVSAGSFTMGSPDSEEGHLDREGPRREVRIAKDIAVGRFEVTREQFEIFVNETGHDTGDKCLVFDGELWSFQSGRSYRDPHYQQDDLHPVCCVNWSDAKAYSTWLSKKTGKKYRLPTEAEWEYVARANSRLAYFFGKSSEDLCKYANVADKSTKFPWSADCDDGHTRTARVGKFAKNDFGLADVLGNVSEWVEDCEHENYRNAPTDGSAWLSDDNGNCAKRGVRGGSWTSNPSVLRSAHRQWATSAKRRANYGFRVVKSIP